MKMSTALYLWNLEIIHDVHHSGGLANMYSRPFKEVKDNWTVLRYNKMKYLLDATRNI